MIKIEINQRVGKKINEAWLNKIAERTLKAVGVKNAEISVAIVGDPEMKKINNFYRGKNRTTDVLSFDYKFQVPSFKFQVDGEIIVSYPQAVRQAGECGWNTKQEIKELLVHGLLHLAGFDHERGEREAKKMKEMEQVILEKF